MWYFDLISFLLIQLSNIYTYIKSINTSDKNHVQVVKWSLSSFEFVVHRSFLFVDDDNDDDGKQCDEMHSAMIKKTFVVFGPQIPMYQHPQGRQAEYAPDGTPITPPRDRTTEVLYQNIHFLFLLMWSWITIYLKPPPAITRVDAAILSFSRLLRVRTREWSRGDVLNDI